MSQESGKNIPTVTADGEIKYAPYDAKVQALHNGNCDAYGWKYTPLTPGAYGYDNLVRTIYEVERYLAEKKDATDLDVAAVVHDAWVKNYVYWRDNIDKILSEETQKQKGVYRKPFKPFTDEIRDKCAATTFADLNEEQRLKDIVLAKLLLMRPSVI